jgi:hypothetical protein
MLNLPAEMIRVNDRDDEVKTKRCNGGVFWVSLKQILMDLRLVSLEVVISYEIGILGFAIQILVYIS